MMADTPAGRLRIALDLYEVGERMYRQRLRREQPDASAVDLDAAVAAWLCRDKEQADARRIQARSTHQP